MVEAAREAMSNAAKHSGAGSVSVYAEVSGEEVRVYVRDQGRGFDTASVPSGRRGVTDSIQGRMERNGGTATIVSDGTEGTEVTLRMPRRPG
jgi:signal transduction histidine kinase